MKKHLTQLLLSLLFLVVTAMTCDEQDWAEPIDVPCTLKEVELYHWDNAGEKPKEAVDNKVLKEAYMMEIRLLTDAGEKDPESYDADHYLRHVLSDGIKKIQIFTETAFVKDQQTDYTVNGGVISMIDEVNKIYKALLTIPQSGGEFRFRVVLTMESGETVERLSDPVTFY